MTKIVRSCLVPFSSAQMYDLVNDIEQYPQFLPWCPRTQILSRTDQEIQATVHFAKGPLSHSFTTLNRLSLNERVEMRLVQGPFRHLVGSWQFTDMPNQGSQILFDLTFEFNNKLLALTLGPLFNQIAGTMVQAFTQRAQQIYVTKRID